MVTVSTANVAFTWLLQVYEKAMGNLMKSHLKRAEIRFPLLCGQWLKYPRSTSGTREDHQQVVSLAHWPPYYITDSLNEHIIELYLLIGGH